MHRRAHAKTSLDLTPPQTRSRGESSPQQIASRQSACQHRTVTVEDDRLELRAPFHSGLPYRSKSLDGRWKGAEVGWVLELARKEAVRGLCLDLFGLDGREKSLRDTVDLEVTVDEHVLQPTVFVAYGQPIAFLGREIAVPLPRRDVARPGRGVRFVKGRPSRQRSVESYLLSIANGSVFTVMAVPRVTLTRFTAAIGDAGAVRVL